MMPSASPPWLPETIVSAILPDPDTRDAVLGDLYEDHLSLLAASGRHAAARWYWLQVLRSLPDLLRASAESLTTRAWVRGAAVVLLSYVCLTVLVMASQAGLDLLLSPPVSERFGPLLSLASSACCGVAGGYVAARLGRRAPLASAMALGAVCVVLAGYFFVAAPAEVPLWYRAALLLVVFPATTAGGLIAARRGPRI